jgi:hypothetical protein
VTTHDLGPEGERLTDWFDTTLWALHNLRNGTWQTPGPDTVHDIDTAITHLHKLLPRLDGLSDALIRAHRAAGGSHAQLATAMDLGSRSAAQSRHERLPNPPSTWERWARGETES